MNNLTTSKPQKPSETPGNDATQLYVQLYHHYRPVLLQYIITIVRQEAPAQELVHDVLLQLWNHLDEVVVMDAPERWLFTCARHAALTKSRKMYRRRIVHLLYHSNEPTVVDFYGAVAHRSSDLQAAIAGLPPRQEAVIGLRLEGYKCHEIALLLGIMPATVRNHITQAIKQLRIRLQS